MNELEGFKVVSTGKTIGGRDISDFFWKKEDAEKLADEWRKSGTECAVIVWKEYAASGF
jgi:hypothetical protein